MALEGDFRDILVQELEKRVRKNPAYSLRAFARDLQLSPAHLSQIVRGKEGFSRVSAQRAAEVLFDSADEIEQFCNLVESQHGRSWAGREAAAKSLNELWAKNKKQITTQSDILSWYHLAILHLSDHKDFQSDAGWIAKYLGLSVEQTENAIDQLLQTELLAQGPQGFYRKQGAFIHSENIPRPVIRAFHKQILEKALESIESQSMDQRFLSSITFAASKENLAEMRESMKRFIAEIERISYKSTSAEKDELSCLSLQLFNLKDSAHV